MAEGHQAEYAQRIATVLNIGVLQDAVAAGLEDQGQFKVDVLDLLDALESAGLKLVVDDGGEVWTTAPVVPDTAADARDTSGTATKMVSAVHTVIARRTGLAIRPVEQEAMAMERPPSP